MAMNPQTKTTTLIGLLIVLVIVAGLLISLSNIAKQQRILSIGSFEECALAGYPIMESYPEQCRTPDGRTFVNEKQQPVSYQNRSGLGLQANGCAVAGCSGQLCVSADEAGDTITCYREASCEPQQDGICGWTQTRELQRCLANPPKTVPQAN
jgi:hypothetical protein